MNVEETLGTQPVDLWVGALVVSLVMAAPAALVVGLVILSRMIRKRIGSSGPYRVVVWESGGSTSQESFDRMKDARSYADDAASEEEEPVARVFDVHGEIVYRGRHYASRYRG